MVNSLGNGMRCVCGDLKCYHRLEMRKMSDYGFEQVSPDRGGCRKCAKCKKFTFKIKPAQLSFV